MHPPPAWFRPRPRRRTRPPRRSRRSGGLRAAGRRPDGARAALLHRRLGLARPGAGGRGPGRRRRRRAADHPHRHVDRPVPGHDLGRLARPERGRQRLRHLRRASGSATRCWSSGSPTTGSASRRRPSQATQELFLVAWLVVIVMLTLATLRLPVAFTAVFFLVDLALLLRVPRGQRGIDRACSRRPGDVDAGVRRARRLPVRLHRLGRHRRARLPARQAADPVGQPGANPHSRRNSERVSTSYTASPLSGAGECRRARSGMPLSSSAARPSRAVPACTRPACTCCLQALR